MEENIINSKSIGDIYRMIYYNRQGSRQEIARSLNISLPTTTQNLNLLRKMGFIYNAGEFESTGGRKPVIVRCVPEARLSMGIDITKNHLSIVVIDLDLNTIAAKRMRIPFEESDNYFQVMQQEVQSIIQNHIPDSDKLLGIGISMPVLIAADQKTVSYATVIPASTKIYDIIKPYFPNVPLLLFNDANCGGLAESWHSADTQPIVYLSLSSSVGGAYMTHHTINTGVNWRGSEFGHITIVPNGKPCYCGQKGCLDAYCSANILSDFTGGNLKQFFDILESGQSKGFEAVFEEYTDYLAIAVNSLRMCYDCDIVLGGYVGAYMDDHINNFRQKAIIRNPFENNADFIRVCHYTTEAAAVGAAIYFINQFIQEF